MMSGIDQLRYVKTFQSLIDDWQLKLGASAVSAIVLTVWEALGDLFNTHLILLFAVIGVMVLDVLTGIAASLKRKNKVTSLGLRQVAVKVIEYSATILVGVMAANAFGKADLNDWVGLLLVPLKNIDYLAYFYVFYTEAISIYENIGGKQSDVSKFWETFKEKIN